METPIGGPHQAHLDMVRNIQARAEKAEAERDRLRAALVGILASFEHRQMSIGWSVVDHEITRAGVDPASLAADEPESPCGTCGHEMDVHDADHFCEVVDCECCQWTPEPYQPVIELRGNKP